MRDKLIKLVQEKGNIPPLPDVLIRLEAKIGDPYSDIGDIAMIIETEPVLSGRLIQLSNSVFFAGGGEKVRDLSSAVVRLGLKMILDLAYTLELPTLFTKNKVMKQHKFWQHSLSVAIVSRLLCEHLRKSEPHICYLSGLMHDIGIMVFSFLIPNEYSDFLKRLDANKKDEKAPQKQLWEIEQEEFGINHPELGAMFIKRWWPIEAVITEAVENHHFENSDVSSLSINSQIVLLANVIANTNGMGNEIPSKPPVISSSFLADLGLNPQGLREIVDQAKESIEQASSVLYQ